jgi:hypothetical protein
MAKTLLWNASERSLAVFLKVLGAIYGGQADGVGFVKIVLSKKYGIAGVG